jgi:hypothetical protein
MHSSLGFRQTGAKLIPSNVSSSTSTDSTSSLSTLGSLRIKPGRTDLPIERITTSMSCSDKLMRWCAIGLQGSLLSHFLDRPLMLHSITVANEHIGETSSSSSSSSSSSITPQLSALYRALIERSVSARQASTNIYSSLLHMSPEELSVPSLYVSKTRFLFGRGSVLSASILSNKVSSNSTLSQSYTLSEAVRSKELGGSGSGASVVPCGASIIAFFSGVNGVERLILTSEGKKRKRGEGRESGRGEGGRGEGGKEGTLGIDKLQVEIVDERKQTLSFSSSTSVMTNLDTLTAIEVLTGSTGELQGATKSADAIKKASIISKGKIYETFKCIWDQYTHIILSSSADKASLESTSKNMPTIYEERKEEELVNLKTPIIDTSSSIKHTTYHACKHCNHGIVSIYRQAINAFHYDNNGKYKAWSFASKDFEQF